MGRYKRCMYARQAREHARARAKILQVVAG